MSIGHVEHLALHGFIFELRKVVYLLEKPPIQLFLILRWSLCFHLMSDYCKVLFLRVFETHSRIVLHSLHGFPGHVYYVADRDEFSGVEGLLGF